MENCRTSRRTRTKKPSTKRGHCEEGSSHTSWNKGDPGCLTWARCRAPLGAVRAWVCHLLEVVEGGGKGKKEGNEEEKREK